jgi:glycerophosphoryl diester phosphodiesterase
MKLNFLFFFLMMGMIRLNAQPAKLPAAKHKFIVVAHRGDHTEVPENTIAAYENGIKNGVDFVEIDLRTTKDSVLVIMHDGKVDRMTNGKGNVSNLTYEEIRQLKIVDKTKGTGNLYDIPTFEEVLKTCRDKVCIYLDFKNASVQQAYDMIKKYGMEKQVVVYINEPSQYVDWKRLVPSMPLMLSMPDNIKTVAELKDFISKYPLEVLDGDYSDYTSTLLQAAKEAGIAVWPNIQSANEDKNWDKALDLGFKGLQTDHPKALIEYLEKKGLR